MKERLMHNIGLKMLAFLTASMLWLIVVNIDDPITTQTYHNIPVSVTNEEVLAQENQTYQIVDNTQTVSITVSGHRSVLNKIGSEDIAAIADMRELTLKTQIPIRVFISRFEGDYEEAVSNPRNLQVRLVEEQTRNFPIVPTTTGTVRDGYALGDIRAVPENVSIRGPVSVISRISKVEAEVSVSGLSQDAMLLSQLVLYDDENNVIDQSLLANNIGIDGVSVSVEILRTKNVPLVFDSSQIEAAEGHNFVGITYEPSEIRVSGSQSELEAVKEIKIPASALKMTGLTERTEQIVDITEYIPDGLNLVDTNAGSVVVTISIDKDGVKTFEVSLGSIVVNGLREELSLAYETGDAVQAQVRGPSDVLESLEIQKYVSIDLSEYKEAGDYEVPVHVRLPQGCKLENTVTVNIILDEK